jgi:hypothetical protein
MGCGASEQKMEPTYAKIKDQGELTSPKVQTALISGEIVFLDEAEHIHAIIDFNDAAIDYTFKNHHSFIDVTTRERIRLPLRGTMVVTCQNQKFKLLFNFAKLGTIREGKSSEKVSQTSSELRMRTKVRRSEDQRSVSFDRIQVYFIRKSNEVPS